MNNIVLVGFMGSGKSTIGQYLARRLRRSFIDVDDEVVNDAGRSIAQIFADEGEPGFRAREATTLKRALQRDRAIIAAGGGAPLQDDNWREIRRGNCVVALMAEPAELARRLNGSNGRPLLQPDASTAIATLLPKRMLRYLQADLVLKTDGKDPSEVAAVIEDRLPASGLIRIRVEVPDAAHEVTIGSQLESLVASTVARISAGPVVVVSDQHVGDRHAEPLLEALSATGVPATLHGVPSGEAAKELSVLESIYGALAAAGIDRQGVVLALGGGTVGDVAGFAAATWMRGIRYVQVPTTLLAMVDSSIGGKTAINLPAGKNLAGAVHQPAAIFCDLDYLATLPAEDYRASLAEVIKAAVIADRSFVRWLWTNLPTVLHRDPSILGEAVSRAIRIKAAVVARDPREVGDRAILNYGHTVGHALERAIGFGRIRHGEAVAWGMEVAARISRMTQRCTPEVAWVQHQLLDMAGLLANRPTVDRAALLEAMRHDKKSRSGEPRWVLLRYLGQVEYGQLVDPSIVSTALGEVLAI
ncbi:MAG TPA: 3-dehydroquinate synthase [Candidatus Acidoferrum sp.]|nr:3-dehydroquinate synthase [Candidatus Acidoferrum sp.]